jgi:hypothetical protein
MWACGNWLDLNPLHTKETKLRVLSHNVTYKHINKTPPRLCEADLPRSVQLRVQSVFVFVHYAHVGKYVFLSHQRGEPMHGSGYVVTIHQTYSMQQHSRLLPITTIMESANKISRLLLLLNNAATKVRNWKKIYAKNDVHF